MTLFLLEEGEAERGGESAGGEREEKGGKANSVVHKYIDTHIRTYIRTCTHTDSCSQRCWALGSSLSSLQTPHEQLERCQVSPLSPPPTYTLGEGEAEGRTLDTHNLTTHQHHTLTTHPNLPYPPLTTPPADHTPTDHTLSDHIPKSLMRCIWTESCQGHRRTRPLRWQDVAAPGEGSGSERGHV